MKLFFALSVFFALSAASSGGKKISAEGYNATLASKKGAASLESSVVAKDVFSTLPADVFRVILHLAGNEYVKMAQVSQLCNEWTRVEHREYLASRLTTANGLSTVSNRFIRSFGNEQHGRLRDDIIAYLVTLVRSCRLNTPERDIDGQNARHLVNLFLQFKRPTSEEYDLLFGRDDYKDKLGPNDLLQLQRLFADDDEMFETLMCKSDEHLEDLRSLISTYVTPQNW